MLLKAQIIYTLELMIVDENLPFNNESYIQIKIMT
jgi:hypothetical protein